MIVNMKGDKIYSPLYYHHDQITTTEQHYKI